MLTSDDLQDRERRMWVHSFEWHLSVVPALMDALVEATLPRIPVSRGGSRFDKDKITGGGFVSPSAISLRCWSTVRPPV